MNKTSRRRLARDAGLRRVSKLTRVAAAVAVAGTGLLAAGFGHALHVPHLNVRTSDGRTTPPAQGGDPSLQGPAQPPSQPQGPPVTQSGGS